ncbi:multidrug effflux MFS transporter [Marivivens aquimaris]|uniref:multidrug effflux MFS transporter n=1 Tax=Marivivens aquimaris TaxID=2774876 RepID=UPI00187E2F05|nr:multidrug effflux MFS transporter [Marivivens aquimaris]
MQPSLARAAFVLGLLSLVGPFAIDMFLPALPTIAAELGVTEAEAQITLVAYFVTFGVAQLIYGPWADQAGRKVPLYVGLAIFLLASVGCALSNDLTSLAISRALQGFGAASFGVIPRAIIRDMHTGPQATKLMSMVMLVIAVSPMLAPLAGSGVLAFGEWRDVFWVLAGVTILSICALHFMQPETLPKERRMPFRVASLGRAAKVLVRDPRFMGLTFIGAFGFSSFFIFIASASFVYTNQFGLTETQFSLAFAANALGFFGTSQIAGPLGARLGAERLIRYGVMVFATFTIGLALVTLAFGGHLVVIMAMLIGANAGLGVVIPSSMVLALDDHGEIAGMASSLGGASQMITGAVMVAIMGPFFDGTATPMVVAIGFCGAICLTLTLLTVRAPRVGFA